MEIEVWSVGKAKFTADTKYQEPAIREAIDQLCTGEPPAGSGPIEVNAW
jgi:hypothetical protein